MVMPIDRADVVRGPSAHTPGIPVRRYLSMLREKAPMVEICYVRLTVGKGSPTDQYILVFFTFCNIFIGTNRGYTQK